MARRLPIFYSALMLTGVNLLLRLAGTSFQVYISTLLGPAGVGLLQLVLSVGGLAMVAGMAGIRTASMYLTAEEIGHKQPQNVTNVLSGCFLYSIVCSSSVAVLLYAFAPQIAAYWIRDLTTVDALRLFACFLPTTCLCGVMSGYFTGANRIGALAAVEVAEQIFSISATMILLNSWAGANSARACLCVVLGSCIGSVFTLSCLILLRILEHPTHGNVQHLPHRLYDTAVPLALADILKSGINTAENLMVPKRLSLHLSTADPLYSFGLVSGMVFPVIMFPACILFGLAELLIPELALCKASNRKNRIRHLVNKSLHVAMLYGITFSGLLYLWSDSLCLWLYKDTSAAPYLRLYSLLIPMLYCDAITDALTKGLGQQKICVRYNIFTSAMDVVFLYLLLPRWGMMGYFVSFFLTHLINFLLSLGRLLHICRQSLPVHIPVLSLTVFAISVLGASGFSSPLLRTAVYVALLGSLLSLCGIVRREDCLWILRLTGLPIHK